MNSDRLVRHRHRDRPFTTTIIDFCAEVVKTDQTTWGICWSPFQKEISFSDFYFELYIGWRGREYINNLHLNITDALF